MKRYKIDGGYYLNGDVYINGSKNASLPIICASIILRRKVRLYNVPDIKDVKLLLDILKKYDVYVKENEDYIEIDSRTMSVKDCLNEDAKEFRASYYLLGALSNSSYDFRVCKQGGCRLGNRPIDLHKYAFKRLGFLLEEDNNTYHLKRVGKPKKTIKFKQITMGATINAILASLSIHKKIKIKNPSLDPEVIDLINFLNEAGYCIDILKNKLIINKKVNLKEEVEYKVMYDRIEAGSYAMIAALVGNRVKIHNFIKEDLSSLLEVFDSMNVKYKLVRNVLTVYKSKNLKGVAVESNPFPGFPTDLMQMLSILTLKVNDASILKDNVFPNRYSQLEELVKYGVEVDLNDVIKVYGNPSFKNGVFYGKDLRGTMSLIMYALNADGVSYVYGNKYVERGYSNMVSKLLDIGACIEVEDVEE